MWTDSDNRTGVRSLQFSTLLFLMSSSQIVESACRKLRLIQLYINRNSRHIIPFQIPPNTSRRPEDKDLPNAFGICVGVPVWERVLHMWLHRRDQPFELTAFPLKGSVTPVYSRRVFIINHRQSIHGLCHASLHAAPGTEARFRLHSLRPYLRTHVLLPLTRFSRLFPCRQLKKKSPRIPGLFLRHPNHTSAFTRASSAAHELATRLWFFDAFWSASVHMLIGCVFRVVALMLGCIGSKAYHDTCIIAGLTIKHHLRAEHEVTHSSVRIDLVCVKPKQSKWKTRGVTQSWMPMQCICPCSCIHTPVCVWLCVRGSVCLCVCVCVCVSALLCVCVSVCVVDCCVAYHTQGKATSLWE